MDSLSPAIIIIHAQFTTEVHFLPGVPRHPPRNTSKVCSRVHSSLTRSVVEILHEPVTRQCPSGNFQPPTASNLPPARQNRSSQMPLNDSATYSFFFLLRSSMDDQGLHVDSIDLGREEDVNRRYSGYTDSIDRSSNY